jgi:hypothetical protein
MAKPERHLRIVDADSGEVLDSCPNCAGAEKEVRAWRVRYANLARDKDQEARDHDLWPKAITLFSEWKVATGKVRSKWSADRFWLCEPYLRNDGFVLCRWAVWGVAYMPNRKQLPDGNYEVYQDFELPFRSRGHFERYTNRGYMNPEARAQFDLREQGIDLKRLEKGKEVE